MPRDGSGNYSRTDGTRTGTTVWDKAKTAGVKIISTDHDTHDQDMASAINDSVAKDGQTPMTGNLDMGGNKVTNTTPTTGTFTPAYRVLGGGSFSYTTQDGYYTLIDKVCFFHISIAGVKVSSPSQFIEIESLPFVPSANATSSISIGNSSGITTTDLRGYISPSVQRIFIVDEDGNFVTYSSVTSPLFYISGFYEVV